MQLRFLYPAIENIQPDDPLTGCKHWRTDENCKPVIYDGEKLPRDPGELPPCMLDPPGKCARLEVGLDGFTPENEAVFQKYMEGRALFGFLDEDFQDPRFRKDASILMRAHDSIQQMLTHRAVWGSGDSSGS